jgi:multidrug efflux pump subunit AcrB
MTELGAAGKLAKAFIHSKLTPLIIGGSLLLGAFAVWKLPREEEPQIIVPMIDVFVQMPGASAREVEERVTKPMEKLLYEVPGVEYLYSTSSPGMSMVIVRFLVGQNEEQSIVRLNQKLFANFDLMPPGVSPPLVKPRSIDDVPILAITLSSKRYADFELRRVAAQLHDVVKQTPDVSAVSILGGQRRTVQVTLDNGKLAAYSLSPMQVMGALGASNRRLESGKFSSGNTEFTLETGEFLRTPRDVGDVVAGVANGKPVFVRDVAEIADQGEEPSQYVRISKGGSFYPAVTIAVSKRKGTNAIAVAEQVLARVEAMRSSVVPSEVAVDITRHYGKTAEEKSDELLYHMLIAVVSVSLLIALTLGFRESLIAFTAIPVTLALTLTVFYLYGYTLNRITLFALIFSIGILVDDAIVVVENIVRHTRMAGNRGRALADVAVEAVNEVGNPTILATLTVVAAILPMAFVGGLMGPYMRPIPIGATAAMLFSLVVAFIVTPWAAVRLLKKESAHGHGEGEDWSTRLYRSFMGRLLHHGGWRWGFLTMVTVLLLASCGLVYIEFVKVKMLPFDNKSEFQVIVDMPEGTTLEQTQRVTQELAAIVVAKNKEVTDVETYAGTASPFNFNGLVRHYYLRRGSNVADIQVNLLNKHERDEQSHSIAKRVRGQLLPVASKYGANIKVAEVPPGPPVLSTLVAEVYGPTREGQVKLARQIRGVLESTGGVVDVDWYVEDDAPKYKLLIDRDKAALHGISADDIARTLRVASAGEPAGLLHVPSEKEDIPIVVRLDRGTRSNLERIQDLKLPGRSGALVPLRELVRTEQAIEDKSIYHKNLMPVTYVTADVAGAMESPVYAILAVGPKIDKIKVDGYSIEQYTARQPGDEKRYAMKWDGEWHITYEVFRDLGIAFAAVMILIYVLVVGWFQSFVTPLVIMAAIPFSLVGILPAHGMMNAFFTATSMIGFIAGAGIVVRNSIILVDFVELRLAEGFPLDQAVIDAGAVRFRPMMLTAAAVVVGSAVILFDPIFQGLAIALMAGEIASLLLSRMTVPVLYYVINRRRERAAVK